MRAKKDHPGVYPPPPLFYVATFFLSIALQKLVPLRMDFIDTGYIRFGGFGLIGLAVICVLPALIKFLTTRNTLITIKPARSLQVSGIYAVSRNPMYLGLLLMYSGVAFFKGNPWTFILIPVLILIINRFIIRNEERYLERAFGSAYQDYKQKVRRWI